MKKTKRPERPDKQRTAAGKRWVSNIGAKIIQQMFPVSPRTKHAKLERRGTYLAFLGLVAGAKRIAGTAREEKEIDEMIGKLRVEAFTLPPEEQAAFFRGYSRALQTLAQVMKGNGSLGKGNSASPVYAVLMQHADTLRPPFVGKVSDVRKLLVEVLGDKAPSQKALEKLLGRNQVPGFRPVGAPSGTRK